MRTVHRWWRTHDGGCCVKSYYCYAWVELPHPCSLGRCRPFAKMAMSLERSLSLVVVDGRILLLAVHSGQCQSTSSHSIYMRNKDTKRSEGATIQRT